MRVFLDRSQYIIRSARGRRREFGSLKPRRLGYKGRCKVLCVAGAATFSWLVAVQRRAKASEENAPMSGFTHSLATRLKKNKNFCFY